VLDYVIEPPRIYSSFADFERDERQRRGLPELAPTPPAVIVLTPSPSPIVVRVRPSPALKVVVEHVDPAKLRAEGVLEIGGAPGTSVLFVRTRKALHLLHTTWIPDRQVDDYAVRLAVNWIEGYGMPSYEVAQNLGVGEATLRKALSAAGYERLSPERHSQLASARSARKMGKRGRLVRTAQVEARL